MKRFFNLFGRKLRHSQNNIHVPLSEHYIVRRKIEFINGEYEIAEVKSKSCLNHIQFERIINNNLGIFPFFGITLGYIITSYVYMGNSFVLLFNCITGIPLYIILLTNYILAKRMSIRKITLLEKNKVKFKFYYSFKSKVVNISDLSIVNEQNYTLNFSKDRTPYFLINIPVLIKNKIYYIEEYIYIYDRELFCLIFKGKNIVFEEEGLSDEIDKSKIKLLKTNDYINYYE